MAKVGKFVSLEEMSQCEVTDGGQSFNFRTIKGVYVYIFQKVSLKGDGITVHAGT